MCQVKGDPDSLDQTSAICAHCEGPSVDENIIVDSTGGCRPGNLLDPVRALSSGWAMRERMRWICDIPR